MATMKIKPIENEEIVEALEPYFPVLSEMVDKAFLGHLRSVPIMGLARKTERANDIHRAIRTKFRGLSDAASDLFELREEPEGVGMDYLIFRGLSDRP